MLTGISWSSYLTAMAVLVLVWYSFLIYRYQLKNIKDIFKGKLKTGASNKSQENNNSPFADYNESFSTLEDAQELYVKLLGIFTESNDRGISKTQFMYYVRFVLAEYPFVKQSALREKINSLAVSESLKYPEFILTSEVMDSLWEEEV
ncbi:hypothetical protein J2Y38_002100 [Flavobacterium sp. 2755]|uniref:hypothetical protein n=1 Tax=Flavobacterium sp. 2755 TaxID=2817765 RepID=UPI002858BB37|nr:hypothetical protein [Flavobacterium sp. 2755]MDR6761891.1 hypothetical protein [Flavobacterium sp. 2755]